MNLQRRIERLENQAQAAVSSGEPLRWLTVEVYHGEDEAEQIAKAEAAWLAEHDELPKGNARFRYVIVYSAGMTRDGEVIGSD